MKNKLRIWSERYSVARGWDWKEERVVTEQTYKKWLEIFRQDEPGVVFVVKVTKPTPRN